MITSSARPFFLFLVGALVACSANVSIEDGEGGEGGDGDGGSTIVPPPPNPVGCPEQPPTAHYECAFEGGSCTYLEHGCTTVWECVDVGDVCNPDNCEAFDHWEAIEADCAPEAVSCEDANAGDKCALPGEWCTVHCPSEDKWCTAEHVWAVEPFEDPCCGDDCN